MKGQPVTGATDCRSFRLSSVLCADEGSTASSLAGDRQTSLSAGAVHPSADHHRVRDLVWNFELHLAAALRDNGGGRLIGSEFEPSKIVRARENLAAGGLSDLVEIREGDALETLASDLPNSIDFVLLDGAKNLYPSILSLLESRLRDGALVVADNADSSPEYLARVRSTAHGYLSVPFGDDVELSMRLAKAAPGNGASAAR